MSRRESHDNTHLGSVGVWAGIRLDDDEESDVFRLVKYYHRQKTSGGVFLGEILVLLCM